MSRTDISDDEINFVVADFLRQNLRVEIDFQESYAYYESNRLAVKVMLGEECITESSVSLPDWEKAKDRGDW